jgi:hypothetical protein
MKHQVIATLGGLLGPIGLYFLVSVLFDAGEHWPSAVKSSR